MPFVPRKSLAALVTGMALVFGVSAPAVSSAQPILAPGTPQAQFVDNTLRPLLSDPLTPEPVRSAVDRVITFLDGSAGGGPGIPQDGPAISQFFYPVVGNGCIGPGQNSVASALAVPGPALLPPPGPGSGQAGFVFTALGTEGPAEVQQAPLQVSWFNLTTLAGGTATLDNSANINPGGPTTLSAIADTGSGNVVAVIRGSISTQAGITCSFPPTLGAFTVA
ncbi:Rv1157c family protein [Millisia brevis]|uniref:Rv1157c family protein n=1 Tax=Millisia brevis TaxID=264148 RepID=UPI000A4F4B1D|nr:hypothetical protein [Millisia brevis]